MKGNKGITLASLIIYIIGLIVLVGTMSMLTKYFYNNLDEVTIENKQSEEYAEFINYLTKDANSEKIENVFIGEENKSVLFKFNDATSHKYVFSSDSASNSGSIYYLDIEEATVQKKIELCTDISECTFKLEGNTLEMAITFNQGAKWGQVLNVQKAN